MSLSFVSINVEREKHYERVLPFLTEKKPDVTCVQEIYEDDVPRFKEALGVDQVSFAPMTRHEGHIQGIAIFSRIPQNSRFTYYHGDGSITDHDSTSLESKNRTENFALLVAEIEIEGKLYRAATTHFTWTPDGEADDVQREDLERLFALLKEGGELFLAGDFNAPRGREIFDTIAARYKDNIPPEYTTSLDGNLHRAGPLPYVVDGLFTTAAYTASDVSLVSGLSDHCAIVATIESSLSI